jgi:hypothetical protein
MSTTGFFCVSPEALAIPPRSRQMVMAMMIFLNIASSMLWYL